MNIDYEVVRYLELLGCFIEFILAHAGNATDFALHHAHVANGLNDIACTGLALGTYHGSAFGNATEGFSQILGTTYEGHVKLGLVDVIDIVGRREYLALVDIVNLDSLQDLCLGNMADTALSHYRNADSLLDSLYHLGVTHT